MESYRAIGIMSGSSLDGIDIAYCKFDLFEKKWSYKILESATIPLGKWTEILKNAPKLDSKSLNVIDVEFGNFLGKCCHKFMEEKKISSIDLIASHGHTVFHYPDLGFTCQIGHGSNIAHESSQLVVNNFRNADIAAGGQGAPIVPIGDLYLFEDYDFCLNIGGIANISFKNQKKIIAFDICAANQVLNFYANQKGEMYDKDGSLAKNGIIHKPLLESLNQIKYYQLSAPKSLDNTFSQKIIEIIDTHRSLSVEDKLATYTEHMAFQINKGIENCHKKLKNKKLLVTGGGAFNHFLIERIKAYSKVNVVIPQNEIINYKEALVIAFMGVLRIRKEVNCLASVSGATKNTICGTIYL